MYILFNLNYLPIKKCCVYSFYLRVWLCNHVNITRSRKIPLKFSLIKIVEVLFVKFLHIYIYIKSISFKIFWFPTGMMAINFGHLKSKELLSYGIKFVAWCLYCFWLAKVLNLLMYVPNSPTIYWFPKLVSLALLSHWINSMDTRIVCYL